MRNLAGIATPVRVAWLSVGIALALFLLLESAMSLLLWAGTRVAGGASASGDYRALADTYKGATWVSDYYLELQASSKVAWAPYAYWRRGAFKGSYINTDGNGIRRTVHEAAPSAFPTAPVRIFMFGGSTLWGTGVRDEFTVPSLLARELRTHGVNAEITNFGETGYVSTQEVISLMLELRKQNIPDLVIFYDGVNDVFSAYQQNSAGLPQNEMHRIQEFNLSQPGEWPRALGVAVSGLARSLSLVRAARIALGAIDSRSKSAGPAPVQASTRFLETAEVVLKTYRGNMRIVQALGSEYGFRPLFFWQPTVFGKRVLTPYEEDEAAKQLALRPLVLSIDEVIRRRRFSGMEAASFFDLNDIFEGEQAPIFIDWCHVGERGNNVIALAMARRLLTGEWLSAPLSPPRG